MCGIAGYFGAGTRGDLECMIAAEAHRGPDAKGFRVFPAAGLGHARLAILDVAGGVQPMGDPTDRICISFNGEIYNFRELRTELERIGVRFATDSDTEVIVQGYLAWGERVFARLDGMFAIAIYDQKNHALFLGRDRLGKKPLYWTKVGQTVFFASELQALLALPAVPRALSHDAITSYFLFDAAPTPQSLVTGIQKLQPGSFLQITAAGQTEHVFWQPPRYEKDPAFERASALKNFDGVFRDAVQRRLLLADVPVGVFLSGGIDSSTVAWYASQIAPGKVRTFGVAFADASYDESQYARLVAQKIGSIHTEIVLTDAEACGVVPLLGTLADEPIADPSFVPTYLLAKATRQSVTVALSGDGGDELFLGYPTFLASRWSSLGLGVPGVRDFLQGIQSFVPASGGYMSPGFVLERLVRDLSPDPLARDLAWRGSFSTDVLQKILPGASAKKTFAETVAYWNAETKGMAPQDALTRMYLRHYLMDVVLQKVDRASMATSLEVRSPFLATAVVEAALRLPWQEKLGLFQGKKFLQRLMDGRLPQHIVHRRKHGFALPVAAWFRTSLKDTVLDTLSSTALSDAGFYDVPAVLALRDAHLSGKADHRKELWALLSFELWRQTFGLR